MSSNGCIDSLRFALRKFGSAKGGNVLFTFALVSVPVLGLVGAAVDYSRGNSAKAAMQQAIDATGLMLSREATGLDSAQLSQKADTYFKALLNRPEIMDVVVNPTLTTLQESSFKLEVVATGNVPVSFMQVLGMSKLDLQVDTEVRWGVKKLELALALDNTGSMASSNKMTELKKALLNVKGQNGATADGLLETLKKAAKKAGDIKISIIAFDTTVKIGTTYKNETWIDWDEAYGTCSKSATPNTKTRCTAVNGNWTKNNNKNNWSGCVIDRDKNGDNDALDTAPDGTAAKKFPATDECGSIVQSLPLTDIWDTGYTTLKNKINAMQPNGNTNVTIGLAWGWHSLTSGTPFTDGAAPSPDIDKVIILLTDGENTQNRWTSNSTSIDNRTKAACANIKAVNIKLYTIRVIDGNASLLQSCATKPTMYYNVSQASQLNPVFAAIAQALANLRIAK